MIVLDRVSRSFGEQRAVDDVSLEIAAGEFFSMLGPSGCGKTTTLRMIAGFEEPDAGRVMLAGEDVTLRLAARRNVNMVFQDYALFPHMTVAENVALRPQAEAGAARRGRATRVAEMLAVVRLEGLGERRPAELSGGQRQRVALARALVNRPAALLLDEPLGALDLKLRREMQFELKRIQKTTGTTFVYVTHDQEEALTMSDRIAVMDGGRRAAARRPEDALRAAPDRRSSPTSSAPPTRSARASTGRDGELAVMELGDGDADRRPRPGRLPRDRCRSACGRRRSGSADPRHGGRLARRRPRGRARLPGIAVADGRRARDRRAARRPRAQRRRGRGAGAGRRRDAELGRRATA